MINEFIKGDLLVAFEELKFDAIAHGCNCYCKMGSGIAKPIKQKYPAAYKADCETKEGDRTKLGTYSKADTKFGTVINAYTQYNFWDPGRNADYDAIKSVFEKINIDFKDKTIGIPLIGCGLAGGDWNVVSKLINDATPDVNIVVYFL